jgi:carbon monoxide dehydrogenase subunit G
MELEHSFTIPVPPEQAWQVLLDVEQIAPCMPGATVDSVDGDKIAGRIKVKVGPVAMTYSGTARFVERDDQAHAVTLEASGKETRGAGTASATVRSTLQDEGGQTKVVVHTTLSVTGRPAQFGRGVMAEVSGRIIERFATNLAAQLASGSVLAAGAAASNGSGPGADAPGPGAAAAASGGAEATAGAATAASGGAEAATDSAAGPATIEDLQLPVRAHNSLRRVGIHTVDDLSARTEAELLAIENLGPQSVREIKERLAGVGRHLAERAADGATSGAAASDGDSRAPASDGSGAAASDGSGAAASDGSGAAASDGSGAAAANGTWAGAGAPGGGAATAPRAPRPPDEDAIDLLSVAGFPVLKRALPVVGAVLVLVLVILGIRGKRRRRG